jgi:hypothetical protein
MKTATVTKELDGTWTVDDKFCGQDGFATKKYAQYAMMVYCWSGVMLTPAQAKIQMPDNWTM